jgi:hypothetical protein
LYGHGISGALCLRIFGVLARVEPKWETEKEEKWVVGQRDVEMKKGKERECVRKEK